jgi:hypothetical protein
VRGRAAGEFLELEAERRLSHVRGDQVRPGAEERLSAEPKEVAYEEKAEVFGLQALDLV